MALLKIDMALSFVQAGEEDIDRIQEVAYTSWRSHYPGIISDAQIEFMLAKMYSKEAIQEQLLIQNHTFLLGSLQKHVVAIASFSAFDQEEWKLHKLYLLPEFKGKGIGRAILTEVEMMVAKLGAKRLVLNVNRNNPTVHFYEKLGYTIGEIIDIPYYDFVLNDYIMVKSLSIK